MHIILFTTCKSLQMYKCVMLVSNVFHLFKFIRFSSLCSSACHKPNNSLRCVFIYESTKIYFGYVLMSIVVGIVCLTTFVSGWCFNEVHWLYGVSLWKNIRRVWMEFSRHTRFEVGDGSKIKLWPGKWYVD
jgi:hypothetical protein